jgi:hypothetical protein
MNKREYDNDRQTRFREGERDYYNQSQIKHNRKYRITHKDDVAIKRVGHLYVRLSAQERAELDSEVAATGLTIAETVRQAISFYIKRDK